MNVSLPPTLREWVDEQVQLGGYGTASEFIRDMLRQARAGQQRARIEPLLLEAVQTGATVEMDDADWTEIRKTARKMARKSHRSKRR